MMFRFFFLFLLVSTLLNTACRAGATPILVRNVRIWTGDRLLQEGRDVLVRDGRAHRVRSSISPQNGWATLDGTGHTLLPGLIDLHLHFSVPGLPRHLRDYEVTGRQLLRSGVTGGRVHLTSIASGKELKQRSAVNCSLQPRLQIGGPGLGGVPRTQESAYSGATWWEMETWRPLGIPLNHLLRAAHIHRGLNSRVIRCRTYRGRGSRRLRALQGLDWGGYS